MTFTSNQFNISKKLLSFSILSFFYLTSFSQNKTVGLTKHLNGGEEDGYILFTPLSTDTTYLINKCGKRVHSWYSQYTPGLSVYLKPDGHLLKTGTYTDTVFGFAGGRGGIIEEYDWDDKLVWRYKLFNDSLCQHHDITPLPNGNVLVLAWHAITKNEAIALGRKDANFGPSQNDLWGERIIELKPIGKDSAAIVWQWDLFDHIIQDYDSTKPNFGAISSNPGLLDINYALNVQTNDWIHANGLDFNEKLNQIVVSCHNLSEIWVIDHSTTKKESGTHKGGNLNKGGDFLYRWGNPETYGKGTPQDRKLFRQHNAQWIKGGLKDSGSIMIFNNGWNRDTSYSSIDIIQTPLFPNGSYNGTLPYGPVKQSWIYKDSVPTNFYSQIISGAQRLPNGNTLICSGVQGRFFEITPQKKTVWEYFNPRNGSRIQADGETPGNNSVFRCVFYPNTYSAFTGRNLSPKGTVELKPYIYSCNYETIPPKVIALLPKKNDVDVNPNAPLILTFDEGVIPKSGTVTVFQNKTLLETITVPGNNISVNNNAVTISHNKAFGLNARISVIVSKGSFRDSSNNLCAPIDSATWHFFTAKTKPVITGFTPAQNALNASSTAPLEIHFNQNIYKASIGQIILSENSLQKEKIPISSSRISISGKTAFITPSAPFAFNANIVVEYGPCFLDSNGVSNDANTFGDWAFKTVSQPGIVSLSPINKGTGIPVNTAISIEFDRPMIIGSVGNLMIYENNTLKDSIRVNGPRAMISGNTINFDINSDFKKSSRVSILLKQGIMVDTFGTFFTGIDSANWHFTITSPVGLVKNNLQDNICKIYPNPGKGNFLVSSSTKIETIEIYNFTGQKLQFLHSPLNDNTVEIKMKDAAPGHYLLLINGAYSSTVIVE